MLEQIKVVTGNTHYPIYIGSDLLSQASLITQHIFTEQVMVVTNDTVAPLYLAKLQTQLQTYQCDTLILPDGEAYKTLVTLERIVTHLIERQHHRDTTLIALGGGVIGDLTGFAAACYMRGVAYLQIPTSLLAQVDAAIGGKTAVNHPQAKNLIGAFYQPRAVFMDTTTLNSLPEREFKAGLAEVIKYGLIADATFFNWFETHIDNILAREPVALTYLIKRSCQIKADFVAQDEQDKGLRMLLNLGHTFAHALETGAGYGNYLHGEAVAIGLCLAAEISEPLSNFPASDTLRLKRLLAKIGLPLTLPETLSIKQLLSLMTHDKKAKLNRLTLILLKKVGLAYCEHTVDIQWLYNYLKHK